jgi:DNA-binding response OmpR family regulator
MKILIVEDENTLAFVLKEKFINEGYDVTIASDGVMAESLAASVRPEIILLDLMLPKKGGLEVLQTLKSHPELKQIPVVILSNLDSDEDIKQAIFLGAEDYYVKTQHPIAEVVEKVDTILRRPKQAKA